MKRTLLAVLLCSSAFTVSVAMTGCNDKPGTGAPRGGADGGAPPTAVVNLDKVAQDLGWMSKMEANLKTYQSILRDDVTLYAKKYDEQINAVAKSMIPADLRDKKDAKYQLDQTQSQQLMQYVSAGREQIGKLAQLGDQQYQRYNMDWVKEYRQALAPIVRSVAQDKKFNVVLVQSDAIIYADRSVDLTDAVVDAARAKPPQLTEVVMTHLKAPETIQVQPGGAPATSQPATQP